MLFYAIADLEDTFTITEDDMSDVEILNVTLAIERGLTAEDPIVVMDYSFD